MEALGSMLSGPPCNLILRIMHVKLRMYSRCLVSSRSIAHIAPAQDKHSLQRMLEKDFPFVPKRAGG
jgi:hypothetical protein